MRVLINAISIAEGGGLVVLKNLLYSMHRVDPSIKWYIAIDPNVLSNIILPENTTILPFTWAKKSPLHHLFWYEMCLPRLVKKIQADICFSQTNFLPIRKLTCPTLLLVQHAGYFSAEFSKAHSLQYNTLRSRVTWILKCRKVIKSIKKATLVTVQTSALAKKINSQIKISSQKISVISHGPGLLSMPIMKVTDFIPPTTWRIGYITKFGIQKDFATAFKAISLLNKKGITVKLILTLGQHTPEYSLIKKLIKLYNIENNIENMGEISDSDQLQSIYQSLHLFIFPSWCESFGFTLLEAMAVALPLIVADTESNAEIVKNESALFLTGNALDLSEKIEQYINDKNLYKVASQRSLERAKDFCWQNTAKKMVDTMRELMMLANQGCPQ